MVFKMLNHRVLQETMQSRNKSLGKLRMPPRPRNGKSKWRKRKHKMHVVQLIKFSTQPDFPFICQWPLLSTNVLNFHIAPKSFYAVPASC
ncbi:hypothetical protein KFK09_029011 [Dendrobium nobile]|uniref:Uncharacterized protein n=1 Tax=Dendrobium nobile TaxID=94219 RepID=A0A8T3A516_DENNO|nr:hypothetical protein KFK09_029011 [Dendrobium nobile]